MPPNTWYLEMIVMKKILSLCLCLLMVMSLLAACGGQTLSKEAAYQVKIQDALGNPYTENIAIKFLKDGQQVAMQIVNEQGVAEKTLARDSYTVEVQFTDPSAHYVYDTSDLTLTANKTELTVVLAKELGEDKINLAPPEAEPQYIYFITPGCTSITLNPQSRTHYVFSPEQAGTYEFSIAGSDVKIGYYGEIHFIQENCPIEVRDNKFQMSISNDMLGGTPVIGVDAGEGNATLCINRLGDAAWTIEDEEWTYYKADVTVAPYTLPAGSTLNRFDIKSTEGYDLAFNEADGYYHLNSADGPLVLVRLTTAGDSLEYLDSFQEMTESYYLRRIFFAEDGSFIKKEGYNQCLKKYIEGCDKTGGVYPLTEDLKYMIENIGIQQGWFDASQPTYLFRDSDGLNIPGINNEIAWLFMCRYLG